jgi:hypothetical protein
LKNGLVRQEISRNISHGGARRIDAQVIGELELMPTSHP